MSIVSICDNGDVLSLLRIVNIVITIIKIVVPIMLIVVGMLDFLKAIKVGDEDLLSKAKKSFLNKSIAAICVFMVPTLVNVLVTISDPNNEYRECLRLGNDEAIASAYDKRISELIDKAEADNNYTAYYQAYSEVHKLSNDEREKYTARLDAVYKVIQTRMDEAAKAEALQSAGSSYGGYGADNIAATGVYKVEYRDGVFYLPNTRVKSDAEAPRLSGISGTHPEFSRRLQAFLNDAQANGYKITITSGYRAYSHQYNLWKNSTRACSERSKWVACPGGSRHNFGIAADLSFDGTSCKGGWNCNSAATWAHSNASKYNLKFRLSHEAWHIEPDKVEGGHFGSCNVSC